jgi:hypothetical protein
MISLPNVSLIALTDYKFEEHKLAAEKCCEGIEWGDVKIIYDRGIHHNVDNWNRKIIYDLWKYVDTDYAFLFHADGYVIHPELWKDEWLELDYIGSPWPLPSDNYSYLDDIGRLQRVGNSVGLRSRKLLKAPTDYNFEWRPYFGNTNEDGFLCCHHRNFLEERGFKFATFEQALDFGKEYELPEHKGRDTFCFHQAI